MSITFSYLDFFAFQIIAKLGVKLLPHYAKLLHNLSTKN